MKKRKEERGKKGGKEEKVSGKDSSIADGGEWGEEKGRGKIGGRPKN